MISDERFEQFAHDKRMCNVTEEIVSMARELLAYRKAFSEPCGFINPVYFSDGMMGCTLHKKMRHNRLEPLYRKPTIPE